MTSFGKEYLCNTCLSREPTAVIELQISNTSDGGDVDNDAGKKYKVKYSSVSAPATPAKKDLSATARTAMMMDADSSLDMSTRSLLEAQSSDGMYTSGLRYVSLLLSVQCVTVRLISRASSAAHGFSCRIAEFAVCHGICCLSRKNAELSVFCYICI